MVDNDPQPGPSNRNKDDDDDDVNMADLNEDQDVESKLKSVPKNRGIAPKVPLKAKSPKKRRVPADVEDANDFKSSFVRGIILERSL